MNHKDLYKGIKLFHPMLGIVTFIGIDTDIYWCGSSGPSISVGDSKIVYPNEICVKDSDGKNHNGILATECELGE